jgi:hypothetical protein
MNLLLRRFLLWTLACASVICCTNSPARQSGREAVVSPAAAGVLADAGSDDGMVARLIQRYTSDYGSLDRFYPTSLSPLRRGRFVRLTMDWLELLDSIPFPSLDQEEKVDLALFRNMLDHELQQLRSDSIRFDEMLPLIPFAPDLISLEDDRRMLLPIDPEGTAGVLNEQRKLVVRTMATYDSLAVRNPRSVKKSVANRAVNAIGEVRRLLNRWFRYHDGYDPDFSWWVRSPFASLDSALGRYSDFIRDRLVGISAGDNTTIIGDPIGREALMAELRYEMISYTPEELIAIARKEMAWCEARMLEASVEMGFGNEWKKALERVKTLHVPPGEQPELILDLAKEAVKFIEDRDLLTIPSLARETWRMEMLSPEQQLVSPFFLGGEVIQVSYPTDGMSHEQKMMSMRGNNIHFARATVHHELIPGHHLQGFMNSRYRPYRWVFGTPFWTEGWALYWELRLWDLGFARSPEDRVGMLFWRMHRCARIIFSLGFHLEQMSPQECIDYLVDRVGHERDNAAAEVRRSFRGDYGPLYQSAYLLGGLQIRALHTELVESGRLTERLFHDTILRNNRMPIEMVRKLLTGEDVESRHVPSWKFYAEPAKGE